MNRNDFMDVYNVKIGLTHDMLGTNPISLSVMDEHIIDRQRKLIAENSTVNKAINKYLAAKDINEEVKEGELLAIRGKIEEIMGKELSEEEFESMKKGELKELKDLLETFSELKEKGITCFFRNPGGEVNTDTGLKEICIGTHMILGFLKAAGEAISKTKPKKNGVVLHSAAHTSKCINQDISVVAPDGGHFIKASGDIKRDEEGTPVYLQRSLRAKTPQGPRISLAKSEVLPSGTTFEFNIRVLKNSPVEEEVLKTLFSYGVMKGLGQWRNAGYGTFEVVEFQKV